MDEIERIENLADFRTSEMAFISLLSAPELFEPDADQTGKYNIVYRINRGDRIERVANRYKKTVQDIVDRNNLQYPFIDSSKKVSDNPSVKVAGEEILIPTDSPRVVQSSLKQESLEDRKYGTDWKFDFELGDLVINDSDSDVEMTRTVDMIVQQLQIMLETPSGRLIDFPGYGKPLKRGHLSNMWNIALDKINVLNAINSDSRIRSAVINTVSGEGQGDLFFQWEASIIDVETAITGEANYR